MSGLRLLAAVCALAVPGQAADFSASARGTTAAEFLELGVGARAAALGEAYSAAADEASALYWNPAALTCIPKRSVTFMHAAYVDSSYFDYAAYGQNLGASGAWGAGYQYFSAGSITQTDQAGANIGTFRPYDLAATLGYAYVFKGLGPELLDGFSLGLAAKFIRSQVLDAAQTGAVDLGVLSPRYLQERLRLAFTATNLGGTLRFEQSRESLPLALRLGSAYRITERWLAALDAAFPRGDAPYAALGTEYQLLTEGPWKFAGRAGFNSQTVGGIDGFTGASFGAGIGYGGCVMDYAFVPLGGVGQAHLVSLTYNF